MSTARYKPHNHTTNRRIRGPWLDGPRDSICIIEDHEPTEQCVSLQCIASLECKNNGLCSHLQIPLCRLASAVPLWDASVLSVTVYHPHKYVGRARGGGGVVIGQMCHRSDGENVSSYFASLYSAGPWIEQPSIECNMQHFFAGVHDTFISPYTHWFNFL